MVDTVKLSFESDEFSLLRSNEFSNSVTVGGINRTLRNPSKSELALGIYLPRVTLTRRPTKVGIKEQLTIEFSAPKMLFGNNFDEATNEDFEQLVSKLKSALSYIGIDITELSLANARVVCWHPSKNIVLNNYFGCRTVLSALRKVDYARAYSIQKTDFQDGEVLHFHCNSKDIAFYDKLADLRQAKISDKKSREKDNQLQIGLVKVFDSMSDISVLRYEIRINGARAMERNLKSIPKGELVFRRIFHSELSQQILQEHWNTFAAQIDYLSLDVNKPLELLQNYLVENKDATPQSALAAVAGLLVANQESARALRSILDKRFGTHYWPRLKPTMTAVRGRRFEDVTKVTNTLKEFQPTHISTLLKRVA